MANPTPAQFFQQVKAETAKVVWPSRKQTWMTGLMVVIMTTILALFFFAVDTVFEQIVAALLKFAQ